MSVCTFCELIKRKSNVLFESEKVCLMLSPEPSIPGHLIVLPKQHFAIFEQVPDVVVSEMFVVANKANIVLFETLGAVGTNLLVQNGMPAGQRHNHFMINVLPVFENKKLDLSWPPLKISDDEMGDVEFKIKNGSGAVGDFEKEKQVPVETGSSVEIGKDDYRVKHLRRIP